jgi:hypothetical protein
MGDFDKYMDDSMGEPVRQPAGPMNGEFVAEVKKVELKETKDGEGLCVKVELRIGSKPFSGRKVFANFFIGTKDPNKQAGAKYGRQAWRALVDACGFVDLAKATDKQKKAMALGLAVAYDDASFKASEGRALIGKFFQARIAQAVNVGDEKNYPELKGSSAIDPDQFKEVHAACDFSRTDDSEAGGEAPPF